MFYGHCKYNYYNYLKEHSILMILNTIGDNVFRVKKRHHSSEFQSCALVR